jgi:hypothetical protein
LYISVPDLPVWDDTEYPMEIVLLELSGQMRRGTQPAVGWRVGATAANGMNAGVYADTNGVFSVELPPQTYNFIFSAPDPALFRSAAVDAVVLDRDADVLVKVPVD